MASSHPVDRLKSGERTALNQITTEVTPIPLCCKDNSTPGLYSVLVTLLKYAQ